MLEFLYYGILHLRRKAYTDIEMLTVVKWLKFEVFADGQRYV
jgi:hypothetical protein